MKSEIWRTESEEQTIALGRELARDLKGVVLLIGNLGAGKTTLTKGIVEGLGAATADAVSSPTFTLIHQYGDVHHVDLYRLDEAREVRTLGLEDLFAGGGVVLLEWAERFPELLPSDRTEIRIRALDDDAREIRLRRLSGDDNEDGVDLTLIRWMLSLTPAERLQYLHEHVNGILAIRELNAGS